jgi:Periplasmic binding protein-like domain
VHCAEEDGVDRGAERLQRDHFAPGGSRGGRCDERVPLRPAGGHLGFPVLGALAGCRRTGWQAQAGGGHRLGFSPDQNVDSLHPEFDCVTVDDEAGGYAAGAHLLQREYRRLVFITESLDIGSAISLNSATYASAGELRARGVVRAMKDAGLDPGDLEWMLTVGSIQGGRAAAAQLIDRPDPPTGFICHHDDIAAGVLAELRAAGRAVPGEAGVVGYDDSALAARPVS